MNRATTLTLSWLGCTHANWTLVGSLELVLCSCVSSARLKYNYFISNYFHFLCLKTNPSSRPNQLDPCPFLLLFNTQLVTTSAPFGFLEKQYTFMPGLEVMVNLPWRLGAPNLQFESVFFIVIIQNSARMFIYILYSVLNIWHHAHLGVDSLVFIISNCYFTLQ